MSHSEEHYKHEPSHYDHHEESGSHITAPGSKKSKKVIVKVAIIAGSIVVGLLALLLFGVAVMFINYINVPSTSVEQAISEATQAVGSWFQPVIDLYNRATGAAAQVKQATGN